MIRWPPFLILAFLIQQTLACVDVLFVLDNRTMEISRTRALQVARQLPEDQKIRKWVVLSRNDRYVPRVLRNNAELQQVLSTIHGDYDRFLDIATGEIARRTKTFQPFVILLFSETPVNQTLTNMWRGISLAPALHIFRIGSHQKTKMRMISEDQEVDFEKLIECGKTREASLPSSKFSGAHNEIRRAPTSTHRPLTSTRDPYVRRLTFYDASRTLLEEKERLREKKGKTTPDFKSKFTVTRTFKKMTTKALSTTTMAPRATTSFRASKKVQREPTTNKWRPTARTTTPKPFNKIPEAQRFGIAPNSQFLTRSTTKPDSTFWHPNSATFTTTTTPSPPPPSTIDLPPKIEPMDLLVRSNSVQFAMTEQPPITTTMDVMKFFSTTTTRASTRAAPLDYACSADVYFLVDLSQGTGDKSQQYLDIAASAISSLPIAQDKVRVGLISYSGPGRTHVRVYLDKHHDKEKLIEEMFLMERHGGTTRTADAIRYATRIFEGRAHAVRKGVKKILVVFTDGYSQDNPRDAARSARSRGLTVLAVAVKDKAAPPEQEQLVEIGGQMGNVFISPSGRELRDKIIGSQCR